ncbi:ABC transporter permease [Nocardia sp. KC 131]|uniref:ABC transporter permease n=1 Tax=Nocardia arseniciresistens TaxID=3392119 RepID=UPI00398F5437
MKTWRSVLRNGFRRGRIELGFTFGRRRDLLNQVLMIAILVVVIFMLRDRTGESTGGSVGAFILPGLLALTFGTTGMSGIAQALAVEREDGTLLRAKTLPGGMPAYLIGKVLVSSGSALIGALGMLVPALAFLRGLALNTPGAWATLILVAALGLVATLPLGAIIGSLVSSPRSLGVIMLVTMGISSLSGIFFPLSVLPGWLQVVGEAFPVYWIGLGLRSAILPDSAVVHELGESWRTAETFGALAAWAVLGLAVAPIVLRRMARRESGSAVEERRARALARTV